MRVRGGLGAALAAAAVAVAAQPAGSSGSAAGSCAVKHSRTVLANREARVYRVPVSQRKHARREMHACLYATGRDEALDDGDFFRAFRPPGMALRGHILAYGLSVEAEGDEPPFTIVEMVDLRRGESDGSGFAVIAAGDAGPGDTSRIGSLSIGAHRTVAWIACPHDALTAVSSHSDSPRPSCVRPGRYDQVRTIAGRSDVRVLDKGRHIDPASLRVRGTRASWIRGGRRHAARLPRR
jgi:hypothetical protein